MKSFRQYLSEGINIKGIRVPKPEVEQDGSKVYTYPGPTDVLQVAIGPEEDGAHHIMFTHGGSFGRSPGGVHHTTAQTLHILNHVVATLRHHSRKHRATEYTYETADLGRHRLYQRMAKAAGVNALNMVPESEMFSRQQLGNEESIIPRLQNLANAIRRA